MKNFLSGYKAIIIGILLTLVGLVNLITGDITTVEFLNDPNLLVVLNGLGVIFIRLGMKKKPR